MPNRQLPVLQQMVDEIHGRLCNQETGEPTGENEFFDELLKLYDDVSRRPPPTQMREVWRLLGKGDTIRQTDKGYDFGFFDVPESWVGCDGDEFPAAVLRRETIAQQTARCETCENWKLRMRNVSETCEHPNGPHHVPTDGSGYCHLHSANQEREGRG